MSNLVAAATSLGLCIPNQEAAEVAEMEEYLRMVKGGDDLINGVVTILKETLISHLFDLISLDFALEAATRKISKLLQLIYELNKLGYFKKKLIDWPIAIGLENNLLRYVMEPRIDFAHTFAEYSLSEDRTTHAVGVFFLSLSLESGVLIKPFNASLMRSIENGFQEVERFVFFESSVPFQLSSLSAVRRTYIDPLSLAIFRNTRALICSFISTAPADDSVFIKQIGEAIQSFVHKHAKLELSMAKIQKLVISNMIQRAPGFIYARQSGLVRSHDVPLNVLARNHGFSLPNFDNTSTTNGHEPEAGDEPQDDGTTSSINGPKSKAVNANFVTEQGIKGFIEWVQMHPELNVHQRKAVTYLISMAFYAGLRRNEAFGLRASEIIIGKTESHGRIRANSGRGLKSTNSKRDFPLSWLPEELRNELIKTVQLNKGSFKRLITLYAGSTLSAAFFDRCNALLKDYFGDERLTIHSLRHAFATRSLFKLMAASLRLDKQAMPEFIRQEIAGSQEFAESIVGTPRPSASYLWHISKIMGHADPAITLHTYLHGLDYLTYFSFSATRPISYSSTVNRLLGIDNTQAARDALDVFPSGSLGWSYPSAIKAVYAAPIKRLLQDRASINTVLLWPSIGENSYRCPEWAVLAEKLQMLKADVDAHPQNYGQPVVRLSERPLRKGVALQALACMQTVKTSKLSKELLAALTNGFDPKQGHYLLPWSTNQSQQVAALIQAGFEVHVKVLSHGVTAPFERWTRARHRLRVQGTLSIKLRPKNLPKIAKPSNSKKIVKALPTPWKKLEEVKPQGIFLMLCALLM